MAAANRPDRTANPLSRSRRRRRWLAVIALVAILHVLVLFGLVRMPLPRLPDTSQMPAIEAILLPPPPPAAPARPPARPVVRPSPRPAAPQTPPAPAPAEPTPEPAAPALATTSNADATVNAGAGGAGAAANGASAAAAPPAASSPAAPPAPSYAAPESVTMRYASFVNGVQNPDGIIRWEQDGKHYRLAVETRVLWFRFAFQSTGDLDARGLSPTRYEEARRSKVEVARFDHAANTVVFETRGGQAPMPPNFQDRFSVFLQLVGWARGDPQRYARPGVTDTFNVADTREVEAMQVQYVGEEDIDIGTGVVRTKHFMRLPRHANDRRRVEIWLAPTLNWMPARLRQTEPDGTQIDLVYRSSEGR
ncbi:DUF3108 domain-containing protein [Cupriavidus pauculus]|uniref:DUF3108 domain-containing protein n=2 Tax=Cupriavidus pauculus TaxID=82633 RepID=UPI001F20A4A0|nr:DUF3108 domain-containing protein [Cupriavidus pauculus]